MASEASCSHLSPIMMEATKDDKFEKYDVFLSHRGPDTKTGFVGFLYKDLKRHGLQPYLDCKSILTGEGCWESIKDAIKNTPIAVVVFSERLCRVRVVFEGTTCHVGGSFMQEDSPNILPCDALGFA